MLAEVLTNLSGFLLDLTQLGNKMARRNADRIDICCETMEMTLKMTEYIDQIHIEIPALANCRRISFNFQIP